jgi:hypothetical protein
MTIHGVRLGSARSTRPKFGMPRPGRASKAPGDSRSNAPPKRPQGTGRARWGGGWARPQDRQGPVAASRAAGGPQLGSARSCCTQCAQTPRRPLSHVLHTSGEFTLPYPRGAANGWPESERYCRWSTLYRSAEYALRAQLLPCEPATGLTERSIGSRSTIKVERDENITNPGRD